MIRTILALLSCLAIAGCSAPVLPMAERSAPITAPFLDGRIGLQSKVVTDPARPFDIYLLLMINGDRVIDQTKKVAWGSSIIWEGRWQGRYVSVEMTRDIQFVKTFFELDVYIDGNLVETIHV